VCYTAAVQTSFLDRRSQKGSNLQEPFYTSGFLYSPKTHQILLIQSAQPDNTRSLWSTIGGESSGEEEAHIAFQRIISKLLNLNLKAKDIYAVYDYFHDKLAKMNYVFYAEVKNSRAVSTPGKDNFSWVAFGEISKLLFTDHTKQDIIVGERVINLKWREDTNVVPWLSPAK